jgi:hypothetical protein
LSSDGSGNSTFEDLVMGERWILHKTKTEGMLEGELVRRVDGHGWLFYCA